MQNIPLNQNQKQDKFQVDLLLPFKNAKQKKQFIQNYKSRSHAKQLNLQNENIRKQDSLHQVNRQHMHDYNRGEQQWMGQHKRSNQIHQFNDRQDQDIHHENMMEQAEISYDLTNQNYSISQRRNTISLQDISINIKNRIQKAVKQISYSNSNSSKNINGNTNTNTNMDGDQINFQQYQLKQPTSNNQQLSSFKINKVIMQQQTNNKNNQQKKFSNQNSNRPKNNYTQQQLQLENERIINKFNQTSRSSNQSSSIKNQILIQELEQDRKFDSSYNSTGKKQQKEHLGNFRQDGQMGKGNALFGRGDGMKIMQQNYEQKHNQFSSISKQKNTSAQKQLQHKIESETIANLKKKLAQKYGSKKTNSTNIRQKYSQFLKKSHRDFSRIYDTIRKQIRRNQSKLMKTRRQDPILVLEQDLSEAFTQQDRIFKQQIIKDYQKHIIAENQNMSSQDLVRYFRYLLQNAKNLYVKHLRKGK